MICLRQKGCGWSNDLSIHLHNIALYSESVVTETYPSVGVRIILIEDI